MTRDAISQGDSDNDANVDSLKAEVDAARRDVATVWTLVRELGSVVLPEGCKQSESVQAMLDRVSRVISEITEYRSVSVVLFSSSPPFRSAFLSLSPNIDRELVEQLGEAVRSPDQQRRLADTLRGGQPISLGEMGEAVYFPSNRTSVVKHLEAVIKIEPSLPATSVVGRWSRDDELIVPITAKDGSYLGFISVDDPRSGLAPDAQSVLPVVAFAQRLAHVVEYAEIGREVFASEDRARTSAKQLEEANRRVAESAHEAEALLRASKLLLDLSDLERLYRQIVEAVRAEFGFTECALVVDEGRRVVRGEFSDIDDARLVEHDDLARSPEAQSTLAVPLLVDGIAAGTLILESPRAGAFSEADERILTSFAERAALAIRQASLHREIRDALQREAIVRRISTTIRESLDLGSVFLSTVDLVGRELEVDRCVLYGVEANLMVQLAQYTNVGVPRIESRFDTRRFADLYMAAVETGEAVFEDVVSDPRLPPSLVATYLAPIGTRGLLFLPILVGDEMRAVLVLATIGGPRRWTQHEIAVARGVSQQVGMAIHQATLFELVSRGKMEWESTFDALADSILLFDAEGTLRRCNKSAYTAMDVSQDSIGTIRCCELLGYSTLGECPVEEAVRKGKRVVRELSSARFRGPTQISVDLLPEGSKSGTRAVCVARDLTRLREAEAEARQHRAVLATLVENATDAVCAADPRGRITWMNPRARTLLGIQPGVIARDRLVRFLDRAERKRVETILVGLKPDAPIAFECTIRPSTGDERSVAVTSALDVVDGHLQGVLFVARDVTDERRAAERAANADKLRALGRLASGVAHDFNNVLATILGNTQMLRRQARDEESARRLSDIEDAALDGAATVRRIQEFARARGNEPYEVVDIMSLVEGAIEFTRVRWENDARARGIAYEVYASVLGDRPTVMGDPSDLREVFVNIMFNAFDAMQSGGVLRIACSATDTDAIVRFTDTGSGIAQQHLPQIFEPFFTTKGTSGAGLGLAVAYGVLARHGGKVEAASDGMHGTRITVVLPLAGGSVGSESLDAPAVTPLTVLVIDDDEPIRRVLAELLAAQGHRVEVASGGPEGIAMLANTHYDVVFTDLSMPVMDGWEVARRVRTASTRTKVVLITGFGATLEGGVLPAGIDAVVSKPFLYSTLARVLKEITSVEP
jgi:PAS domain S-box-containing protein